MAAKTMKLIKRLVLVIALLLSVAALFVAGGYTLLRGTPDYYRRFAMTPAERAVAAESAEQTLTRIQNLAADAHGVAIREQLRSSTQAAHRG